MINKVVGRHAMLRLSTTLWQGLIAELVRPGGGRRESGAFLLAPTNRTRLAATQAAYFDDLDSQCLTGGISMSSKSFNRLWDHCEQHQLRVIADVHTHPGTGVRQSSTDRDNPMIAQTGHVAVIIPNYAAGTPAAEHVGVHEYLSDAGWREHVGTSAGRALYIGRWA